MIWSIRTRPMRSERKPEIHPPTAEQSSVTVTARPETPVSTCQSGSSVPHDERVDHEIGGIQNPASEAGPKGALLGRIHFRIPCGRMMFAPGDCGHRSLCPPPPDRRAHRDIRPNRFLRCSRAVIKSALAMRSAPVRLKMSRRSDYRITPASSSWKVRAKVTAASRAGQTAPLSGSWVSCALTSVHSFTAHLTPWATTGHRTAAHSNSSCVAAQYCF